MVRRCAYAQVIQNTFSISLWTDLDNRGQMSYQTEESIPEDGTTVDIDAEMKAAAENQILYRASVGITE